LLKPGTMVAAMSGGAKAPFAPVWKTRFGGDDFGF
jgi:hypothetical protein